MSHTTRCGTTTFIHNGGYDGDVQLRIPFGRGRLTEEDNSMMVRVPMEDLLDFVAGYVRGELISWAEQADYQEILLYHFGQRL